PDVERHAQHVAEVDLAADRLEADAARGDDAAPAEQVALSDRRERDHLVGWDAPVLAALLPVALPRLATIRHRPSKRSSRPAPISAGVGAGFSWVARIQLGGNRSRWRSLSPAGTRRERWVTRQ